MYSFGSFNDFSFETAIHERLPQCEIHTFDHTIHVPTNPDFVQFHKWGIGSEGSSENLLKPFSSIVQALGHTDKMIDILKIDVEGAEYPVFISILESTSLLDNVSQLLVEFHFNSGGYDRNVRVLNLLRDKGFAIFHKEPNIQFSDGSCIEIAFIRIQW